MPRNIEIKAKIRNLDQLKQQVEQISDTPVEVIPQTDTFFHVPKGRLKLRELSDHGQLIYYERVDVSGPKQSNYFISRTNEPQSLTEVLTFALGVRGVVRKQRLLYLIGKTRIHLDQVEGLGNFLEFEVVLNDDDTLEEGERIATELMQTLEIEEADLVEGAYWKNDGGLTWNFLTIIFQYLSLHLSDWPCGIFLSKDAWRVPKGRSSAA